MDNKTLREVQMAQLELALEIKRVCDILNINYFLDSGTLLGAVRHKGFIPWDDDLDIGMLRKDYEKFVLEAPLIIDAKYFLQTWDSDEKYGLAYAKLRKNGTVFIEEAAQDVGAHNGIFIDVFPYDAYPNNFRLRIKQKFNLYFLKRLLLVKCGYKPWAVDSSRGIKKYIKAFIYGILKVTSLLISKEKLKKRYYSSSVKYNDFTCDKYFIVDGASEYGTWLVQKSCFEEFVELPFEKELFKCPKNFDLYLSDIYGDYMTPPPENQRENRHNIIDIKF